jgi:hypothetical protein
MTFGPSVDGVLVQRGERLLYPRNRIVRPLPPSRLDALTQRRAAVILGLPQATQSHRELIATQSADRINVARRLLQRRRTSCSMR